MYDFGNMVCLMLPSSAISPSGSISLPCDSSFRLPFAIHSATSVRHMALDNSQGYHSHYRAFTSLTTDAPLQALGKITAGHLVSASSSRPLPTSTIPFFPRLSPHFSLSSYFHTPSTDRSYNASLDGTLLSSYSRSSTISLPTPCAQQVCLPN